MEQKNTMATASLVLGIVSVVLAWFGLYGTIIGLVCGILAIVFAVKGRKIEAKKSMATAGLVLGIIGTVLCGICFACAICALAALGTIANELPKYY